MVRQAHHERIDKPRNDKNVGASFQEGLNAPIKMDNVLREKHSKDVKMLCVILNDAIVFAEKVAVLTKGKKRLVLKGGECRVEQSVLRLYGADRPCIPHI